MIFEDDLKILINRMETYLSATGDLEIVFCRYTANDSSNTLEVAYAGVINTNANQPVLLSHMIECLSSLLNQ